LYALAPFHGPEAFIQLFIGLLRTRGSSWPPPRNTPAAGRTPPNTQAGGVRISVATLQKENIGSYQWCC